MFEIGEEKLREIKEVEYNTVIIKDEVIFKKMLLNSTNFVGMKPKNRLLLILAT